MDLRLVEEPSPTVEVKPTEESVLAPEGRGVVRTFSLPMSASGQNSSTELLSLLPLIMVIGLSSRHSAQIGVPLLALGAFVSWSIFPIHNRYEVDEIGFRHLGTFGKVRFAARWDQIRSVDYLPDKGIWNLVCENGTVHNLPERFREGVFGELIHRLPPEVWKFEEVRPTFIPREIPNRSRAVADYRIFVSAIQMAATMVVLTLMSLTVGGWLSVPTPNPPALILLLVAMALASRQFIGPMWRRYRNETVSFDDKGVTWSLGPERHRVEWSGIQFADMGVRKTMYDSWADSLLLVDGQDAVEIRCEGQVLDLVRSKVTHHAPPNAILVGLSTPTKR